ncbi:MAG: preprotein translocase subunit SecG [Dehalococcoidia bacterium]|nr:preprotein translocase subunit SecG [Dehalococcoidia bacterium]
MPTYLIVSQILVTAALIASVLFQLHGGGIGGIFGQAESVYRTRRGLEKTLFRVTIVLAVVFVIFSILIVKASA